MPLLRRLEYVKQKLPADVGPNDEVFLCKLTGEAFTDYEKFFETTILCNSLVWSCSLTGRPGLTYQEALDSEKRAMLQLDSFPDYFHRPFLYLATLTHRSRLADVNDDLFLFFKDRYVIGEIAEAAISGERKQCKIVNVLPPPGTEPPCHKSSTFNDNDSDIICLDDDTDNDTPSQTMTKIKPKSAENSSTAAVQAKSPANGMCGDRASMFGSDPTKYQYVVEAVKNSTIHIVPAASISRKKGVVTRDKCKIFLKRHCCVAPNGIWCVQESSIVKFNLKTASYDQFFDGPLPTFDKSEAKRKPLLDTKLPKPASSKSTPSSASGKAGQGQGSRPGSGVNKTPPGVIDLTDDDESPQVMKKKLTSAEAANTAKPKKVMSEAELAEIRAMKEIAAAKRAQLEADFQRMRQEIDDRAAIKEKEKQNKIDQRKELLKRAEEDRQKRKMEKDLEREKEREEKRKKEEQHRVWSRPRDDLECDDLKDMPVPTPVDCVIPTELFGDAVLILEYLFSFKTLFELDLPDDISIDSFCKSLLKSDVTGLYSSIVSQLLSTVFRLQDEQSNEENADNKKDADAVADNPYEDRTYKELVKAATAAAQWPMRTYGVPLMELPLDGYSLTEILRLHFLSSGATNRANIKFDYQRRGGYTPHDDPGLELRRTEAKLIKQLGETNIFDLSVGDKLKVVNTLVQQLLTYAASRDFIDDCFDRLKQAQKDLRNHQSNGNKRDRDETLYWLKKKMSNDGKALTPGSVPPTATIDGIPENVLSAPVGDDESSPASRKQKRSKRGANPAEPSDKDYEMMPTENLDWEKFTPVARQRMKDWYVRRERELMDLVNELQNSNSVLPLGRDRIYRRYWVFKSVPGLFIEDDEENVPGDVFSAASVLTPLSSEKNSGGSAGSDKENSIPDECASDVKHNHVISADTASSVAMPDIPRAPSSVICNDSSTPRNTTGGAAPLRPESTMRKLPDGELGLATDIGDSIQLVGLEELLQSRQPAAETKCTTNGLSSSFAQCSASKALSKWSFYNTTAQLDVLISSLNARGNREGALRMALLGQRDRLMDSIKRCDVAALSRPMRDHAAVTTVPEPVRGRGGKGGAKGTAAAAPLASVSNETNLEMNLREMLLDLEERIFLGTLGSLKDVDRSGWRLSIEDGLYCSQQLNGTAKTSSDILPRKSADVIELDSADSCDSSSSDQHRASPAVRGLSAALLQVVDMIDARYLNPPLGEKEDTKKPKSRGGVVKGGYGNKAQASDSEEEEDDEDRTERRTVLERWKESLLTATSLSQIHLHLSILDSSIAWSKSALNARCRICKRKGDGERMLLCDGCDRGHHMYCLKPQVKVVPVGDWFCPECKPKHVVCITPSKSRKSFTVEGSDSDSDSSHSEVSDRSDDMQSDTENEEEEEEEEADDTLIEGEQGESMRDTEEEEEDEVEIRQPAKIKFIRNVKNKAAAQTETKDLIEPKSKQNAMATAGSRQTRSREEAIVQDAKAREAAERDTSKNRRVPKRKSPDDNEEAEEDEDEKTKSLRNSGKRINEAAENGREKRGRWSLESASGRDTRKRGQDIPYYGTCNDDDMLVESRVKSRARDTVEAAALKICEGLVTELMEREEAWPFLRPVNKKDAPDYLNIVVTPMDFSLIRNKIARFDYKTPASLLSDIRLIFNNYKRYNMPTAPVYTAGQKLERFFDRRVRELKLANKGGNSSSSVPLTNGTTGRTDTGKSRKRTL